MITQSYSTTVRLNEETNNALEYLIRRTGLSKTKVISTLILKQATKARASERHDGNARPAEEAATQGA